MCATTEPTYILNQIGPQCVTKVSLKRFNTVAFSSVLMSQGMRKRIYIKVENIYNYQCTWYKFKYFAENSNEFYEH